MAGQTFTGESLLDALKSGEFESAPGPVVVGMVKESGKKGHIAFTAGGCETWVDLPTAMIEEAEHVGSRPCDDHAHPVFRIRLKESEDPQAKLLAAILSAGPATQAPSPMRRPPGRGGLPPGGWRPPGGGPGTAERIQVGGTGAMYCWKACDKLWENCIGYGSVEQCQMQYEACNMLCDAIGLVESIFILYGARAG